jgi:predicted nucleic acid-binding protein
MTDKIMIDTNILVYAYLSADSDKHGKAIAFLNGLINKEVYISTQVLSEVYSALKKNGVANADISYYIDYCIKKYNVLSVTVDEIQTCLSVRDKCNYSYWDCLILATAINNECTLVYSEDMQDRHILFNGVEIHNPLKQN